MQVGSLLTEVVHATMYVGIYVQIFLTHGIQHTQRFLRGSRIVQINQWLTIYLAAQYGEILTYLIYIIHILCDSLYSLFTSETFHFSLTQLAALALVQFSTEALLHQIVQAVAQGLQLHVVYHLVDKGVLQ